MLILELEHGLLAESASHRLLLRVVVEVIGRLCLRHNDYIIGSKRKYLYIEKKKGKNDKEK